MALEFVTLKLVGLCDISFETLLLYDFIRIVRNGGRAGCFEIHGFHSDRITLLNGRRINSIEVSIEGIARIGKK